MCLNVVLSMRSVRGISGATVEHNKFCVSVHFRNVDACQYDAVLGAVEATLQQHQELHATRGRKVFEIRPQVSLPPTCCCDGPSTWQLAFCTKFLSTTLQPAVGAADV